MKATIKTIGAHGFAAFQASTTKGAVATAVEATVTVTVRPDELQDVWKDFDLLVPVQFTVEDADKPLTALFSQAADLTPDLLRAIANALDASV